MMQPDQPTSRLVALAVDANDPMRLARFWAAALGWVVEEPDDDDNDDNGDEVALVPTDGTRFEILFLRVPEEKAGPNRLHLDLGQRPEEGHVVLADPEGNELCIIGPDNQFLAGCPRLGAISCDGSRAVGEFWSAALGWPLVWDQDEETAIRAPDGTGPIISWGGPPVAPKTRKNRLHLDIAPPAGADQQAEVERLTALGAVRVDIGQGDVSWVVMADPDGNEFCVLTPR